MSDLSEDDMSGVGDSQSGGDLEDIPCSAGSLRAADLPASLSQADSGGSSNHLICEKKNEERRDEGRAGVLLHHRTVSELFSTL